MFQQMYSIPFPETFGFSGIFSSRFKGIEGKYIRVSNRIEGMDQPEFSVDQTLGTKNVCG